MKKFYILSFLVLFTTTNFLYAQQFELSQEISVSDKLRRTDLQDKNFAQISDNQAIYGAVGAAYIFEKNSDNQWALKAELSAPEGFTGFGSTASITKDRAIVGAHHNGFIFEKIDNQWEEVVAIKSPDTSTPAVAIAGDYAFVGNAEWNSHTGFVYVYKRNAEGQWEEQQRLHASDESVMFGFGTNVLVENMKVLITTRVLNLDYGYNAGYLFELNDAGLWQEEVKLQSLGNSEASIAPNTGFSGNYVAFSSPGYYGPTFLRPGIAKVYEKTSTGWEATDTFRAPDEESGDYFGIGLAMDGDTLLVQTKEKGTYVYAGDEEEEAWENLQIIRDYNLLDLHGDDAIAYGAEESTVYFFSKASEQTGIAVTGFSLVDAITNQTLGRIHDGDVIDLGEYENDNFNIIVHTEPETIGSVYLELKAFDRNDIYGPKLAIKRTENKMPYALFGDKSGDARNWQPEVNRYTLSANPFAERGKKGLSGKPLDINFRIIDTAPSTTAANTGVAASSALNAYSGTSTSVEYFLLDADNNEVLQKIEDGDAINLRSYTNKNYNILMKAPEGTGSVVSELQLGDNLYIWRIENKVPYTAFGDTNEGFRNWEPEIGFYELTAAAYTEDYGYWGTFGKVGTKIRFLIKDEPIEESAVAARSEGAGLSVYPNPAVSQVHAKVSAEAGQPYQLSVFNAFGEKVFHKSGKGSFDERIDLNRQQPGLYMVVIESQGQREVKRLLVKK